MNPLRGGPDAAGATRITERNAAGANPATGASRGHGRRRGQVTALNRARRMRARDAGAQRPRRPAPDPRAADDDGASRGNHCDACDPHARYEH